MRASPMILPCTHPEMVDLLELHYRRNRRISRFHIRPRVQSNIMLKPMVITFFSALLGAFGQIELKRGANLLEWDLGISLTIIT